MYLIHLLCAHGAKHGFERLGWICDVASCVVAFPNLRWPEVLAASADAAVPHIPGMKELLAASKKPVDQLELTALDVPARSAVMTVTGRARPERKAHKGQLIDTSDPAAAAAELVTALRAAGAL